MDHSPASELSQGDAGAVAGAEGLNRKTGRKWLTSAGAVILATGGNAFRSGVIGTHGVTGDGYLMGAEAGATFVCIEFSEYYGITPCGSSCTKVGMYQYGRIVDGEGQVITDRPSWSSVTDLARALVGGHIPYKGGSQTDAAVLPGEIAVTLRSYNSIADRFGKGDIRLYGVADSEQSKLLPAIPTFAEMGEKNTVAMGVMGLVAPTGTPKAIIAKLTRKF